MQRYKTFAFIAVVLVAVTAFAFSSFGSRGVKATEPNVSVDGVVLQDMNGQPYPLSSLKGKPLYIKMWASWCPICLGGLPDVDALSADTHRNFEVITVVSPGQYREKDIPAFKEWFAQQGYPHMKVLFDTEGQLLKLAHVRAYPTNLIIDKELYIDRSVEGNLTNGQIGAFFFDDKVTPAKGAPPSMESSKERMSAMDTKTMPTHSDKMSGQNLQDLYVAGGCFWGVEAYFERIPGVVDAVSGYANGHTANPTYEEVSHGGSGHTEAVHVVYDANKVSLETLLKYYFKIIDPTSLNRQGNDIGSNYRTGIYYLNNEQRQVAEQVVSEEQKRYTKKIVVEVVPLQGFFKAEEYHQDYLKKHPNGYCHIDLSLAEKPL